MSPDVVIGMVVGVLTILGYGVHLSFQSGRVTSRVAQNTEQVGKLSGKFDEIAKEVGRNTVKADTLWDLIMKDAKVSMLQAGWGKSNSPIQITPDAYQKLLPYLNEMIGVYARLYTENPKVTDRDILIVFNEQFGERLFETVALPNGISPTVVLLAAVELSKANWEKENSHNASS